ncbi:MULTISPECIES: hypothetical protein [Cyanophyceae]|uniref:hypothetical protein n=1 Tax=Cyanophyceae TaxID=3028117 RepID=UPI0016833873|nr:hypothetical protein [Trichocoleus sp. FACHB-40]MBD2005623.1 hypothetical protein [Trichocoleus sp. FACHB-40]
MDLNKNKKVKGFGVKGNDAVGSGGSELDAIRATNAKKGFRGKDGKDSTEAQPETEAPAATPATVAGSDSAAPQPPNNNDINVSADGALTLTKEQLHALMDTQVNNKLRQVNDELNALRSRVENFDAEADAAKRKHDEELATLERQIEDQKRQKNQLSDIFTEFGYAVPGSDASAPQTAYIAPASMRGGMSKRDAVREFEKIREDRTQTKPQMVVNPETGEQSLHTDNRALRRFIRTHRETLRDGMEDLARKSGLLRGQTSDYTGSDAPTSFATIPPALQTYLSEITRSEHSSKFILWQFPNRSVANGIPPGQTILVPRVLHLEAGTSSADWQLDPSVAIVNDSQPLQGSGQPIVIRENGIGKTPASGPALMRPVAIPEFVMSTSLIQLENVLQQRLGYNYHLFEEISILEMWLATTAVAYNRNGDVATAAADVTAGSGGQLGVDFLGSLFAHMSMMKIPTYRDGCYGFAATPTQIAQLNKDLRINHQYLDRQGVEELTNMLFASTGNEDTSDRISGYVGKIAGFHLFQGNNFSTGIVGTPGVQSESLGGSAKTTRSGFAFGADSIGWSTAMPMQVRESNDNDYQRMRKFIWKSQEGWGPLDVDPASNPPTSNNQQLRVIEVRTADTKV